MLVLTDSHFTIKISDCLTENRIKKQVKNTLPAYYINCVK